MGNFGSFRGGGGGGGFGNMQQLMKQAQAMQQKMAEAKEAVAETEVEASAGGDLVKVVVNGDKVIKSIKIQPSACDPSDVEMLEDLIMAALTEAYEKADAVREELMGEFGDMGL